MTHSGGQPHTNTGDFGQRYEVTVFDEAKNARIKIGWSNDAKVASDMGTAAELRPSWKFAQVRDRAVSCDDDRRDGTHSYWSRDGLRCMYCNVLSVHVPKISIIGVEVDLHSSLGRELQQQREEGGFHWKNDIFFKRLPDGSVRVRRPQKFHNHISFHDWTIPAPEWASIVCSVSALGETRERWDAAQDFHGRPSQGEKSGE